MSSGNKGIVGGSRFWTNTGGATIHEMGHTFNWGHQSRWASNNSNPSSSEANKLEHKATRPTDGKIARDGNTCTAGENYTIQLKFWYHGEDRRTVAATILGGSSSVTNTNVTLN